MPDTISTTLIVDLTDAYGKLISRKILPVMDMTVSGNIDIPDSLPGGEYTFRAYTPWMMNFDLAFIFKKNIFIFNSPLPPLRDTTVNTNHSFTFFPEGGNLISGVVNFIAFKGTDHNGYPVSFDGYIMDSDGKSITEFKTTHDGMGKFTLLPLQQEKYSAIINFTDGKKLKIVLPEPEDGIAMHVENDSKNVRISLSRTHANANAQTFLLLGQISNHTVFKTYITIDDESVSIVQPIGSLPSGILQFTLFDDNMHPVSERLTFVNNEEYKINAFLNIDTFNLHKRARNSVTFYVPDSIAGSYSIAITDESKTPIDNKENIISNFLLSSDIKGYVHNPAWYFENNEKITRNSLDLVMMTSGWRRFQWSKIMSGEFPSIKIQSTPYIKFSGKVYAENKRDLVTGGDLNLFIRDKIDSITKFYTVPIDSLGSFKLDSLIYNDTAYVYFNYNTKKRNKKTVFLKPDLTTPFPGLDYHSLSRNSYGLNNKIVSDNSIKIFTEQWTFYNDTRTKVITLKGVTVKVKKKTPTQLVAERYSKVMMPFGGSSVIDLINDPIAKGTSITSLVRRIPRINIGGTLGNPQLYTLRGPVISYLDDIQTDFNLMTYLNAGDLALIAYQYGSLFVYQKKGDDLRGTGANFLSKLTFPGYSVTRQFYSPDYKIKPDVTMRDKRATLCWNPNILLDAENRSEHISFYNSDDCHKIRIIIEGFNMAGQFCRIEKIVGD